MHLLTPKMVPFFPLNTVNIPANFQEKKLWIRRRERRKIMVSSSGLIDNSRYLINDMNKSCAYRKVYLEYAASRRRLYLWRRERRKDWSIAECNVASPPTLAQTVSETPQISHLSPSLAAIKFNKWHVLYQTGGHGVDVTEKLLLSLKA